MIRNALAILATFTILGCEREIEDFGKFEAERRSQPAAIKWYALTDLEKTATYSIAVGIANRCSNIAISKLEDDRVKPVLNRVAVFKGKDAAIAAIKAGDEAFSKKYGKPLIADLDHCDAGRTEISQQTAVSFLWTQN